MTEAKPRKKRRSLAGLTAALERATTRGGQARAHYELGLFHDNNGREAQAIPHYREALALGIESEVVPEALAWLASSLSKTGHPEEAARRAGQALRLTTDPSLEGFLRRLLRRIDRAVDESQ
ncbi:MAG: tetratricopeptide repeat protein [Chloroflexota bacterium]|nr:tetratricopeptide repeat protein [Chloroflexota bacterium]MDE2919359.1 tetratricopeptide repeat protein [Chloroflexota bacterium]